MNHLAIVQPSTLTKILDGTKPVESRFGKHRPPAWKCQSGDSVYFKEKGGDIRALALVGEVDRFQLDQPWQILGLEKRYWSQVHGSKRNLPYWLNAIERGIRYVVLITLADVESIVIPKQTLPRNLPYVAGWICDFKLNGSSTHSEEMIHAPMLFQISAAASSSKPRT